MFGSLTLSKYVKKAHVEKTVQNYELQKKVNNGTATHEDLNTIKSNDGALQVIKKIMEICEKRGRY